MKKNITPILAFKDNYIWMFIHDESRTAWVVDPGDAEPVIATLKKYNLDLAGVLITHHHPDHTGGLYGLLAHWKNIVIYGSHTSNIKQINHPVKEGDEIVCGHFRFKVLEIPGHTLDHIAFYNDQVLFSGDTLFSMGCGRVFEGTPNQMHHSLEKLKQLSDAVKVFCGHEYTLANLLFAQHVDPNNAAIAEKIRATNLLRDQNQPTLPSLLADEKKLNPFLRCDDPVIIAAVEKHIDKKLTNAVDVFAALREWKNQF